jgi:hypothetical protein
MERTLFRVQYTYADGTSSYEPVCIRAATGDAAAALAEVTTATSRYLTAVGATRTITVVVVTPDV